MSINTTDLSDSLPVIFQHLIEVIDFLQQNEADNDKQQTHSANTKDTPVDTFSLLLISDPSVADLLSTRLQRAYPQIHITTMTATDFIHAAFDKRYDLGCFIESSPLDRQPSTLTSETADIDIKERQSIAIRLRDLFAEQSLLFLTQSTPKTALNGLGYISVPITESANKGSENQTQIFGWQFNLYDYKQRPDWLNAKYWANPENFDKYRW